MDLAFFKYWKCFKKNNGFSRNDLGVRNPLSKVAIEHFLVFRGTLRARFCAPLGFFTKNPEGNQLLASPKVVRSSRPPSCWRQDTEFLTKC